MVFKILKDNFKVFISTKGQMVNDSCVGIHMNIKSYSENGSKTKLRTNYTSFIIFVH